MCDGMSPNAMFSNGSEHVSENMTKHAVWMSQNVQKRQANSDIGAFWVFTDPPTCHQPLENIRVGDMWDDVWTSILSESFIFPGENERF